MHAWVRRAISCIKGVCISNYILLCREVADPRAQKEFVRQRTQACFRREHVCITGHKRGGLARTGLQRECPVFAQNCTNHAHADNERTLVEIKKSFVNPTCIEFGDSYVLQIDNITQSLRGNIH